MSKLHGEWEKILWKKQPFSDNYVPLGLFLSSLKRNSNFRPYTYWSLVFLSCTITQHMSTIFIFLVTFIRLKEKRLDPHNLVWMTTGSFLIGYMIWEAISYSRAHKYVNHLKVVKSSILIFLALMSLSPVLRTLTAATSSDSIWALSSILFALNALLADYTLQKPDGEVHKHLTSVLSMDAAVSASVVLASRLNTDIAVFALMLFSVQAFVLFPILRHHLQASPVIQSSLTLFLSVLTLILTTLHSWMITFIFTMCLLFVTFLAPAMLLWAQKHKNEIRGPWDVAVPKVN